MRTMESLPVTTYQEFVSEITCNRCGRKHEFPTSTESMYDEPKELDQNHEISLSFRPLSMFSSQHWKFDLCEECLLTIIRDFTLVPDGFMQTALPSTDPQAQFNNWKNTGKWDWRYGYSDDMLESIGIYTGGIKLANVNDDLVIPTKLTTITSVKFELRLPHENDIGPAIERLVKRIYNDLKKNGVQL